MPDHVHLLIWPLESEYSISKILGDIKQPVTRTAIRWLKEHAADFLERLKDVQPDGKTSYRFWQRGGGYDRNMLDPRTIHAEIEYIHMNPVRRGLVHMPEEWPWSSARFFAGQTGGFPAPDTESIPDRRSVPNLS